MEMMIKKFLSIEFGELTTIKSPTGKVMFVGKEVAKQWEHTNITQAIKNARLERDEFLVIHLKQYPEFRQQLSKSRLVTPSTPTFTLITEAGLYKLILASNKENAIPFRNWLAQEVLPSIRETGSYSLSQVSVSELAKQTIREIQIENSKSVNSKNYTEKGLPAVIDYNRNNCKQVTGMEPSQIRKIAGKKHASAKEILRQTNPELAATMSLNDHMVSEHGAELKKLTGLDQAAVSFFKEVIKLGFVITEKTK